MMSTSGWVWTKRRVSFLSVSRRFSRASTASAKRASRSSDCAMRVQFEQRPQKSGKTSPQGRTGEAGIEVFGLRDAGAVRAASAEIGQAIAVGPSLGDGLLQAVHGAGEHQGESVLARSVCAAKNDGVRKAFARQHLAQAMDGFRVAGEIRKGHRVNFVIW